MSHWDEDEGKVVGGLEVIDVEKPKMKPRDVIPSTEPGVEIMQRERGDDENFPLGINPVHFSDEYLDLVHQRRKIVEACLLRGMTRKRIATMFWLDVDALTGKPYRRFIPSKDFQACYALVMRDAERVEKELDEESATIGGPRAKKVYVRRINKLIAKTDEVIDAPYGKYSEQAVMAAIKLQHELARSSAKVESVDIEQGTGDGADDNSNSWTVRTAKGGTAHVMKGTPDQVRNIGEEEEPN